MQPGGCTGRKDLNENLGMKVMDKKMVVLNGSPRKNGNTSALVREFAKGAKSAGNTVIEFFLNSMDIHGCLGCFGGYSSKECPCVQKDDMSRIYQVVKAWMSLCLPRCCITGI